MCVVRKIRHHAVSRPTPSSRYYHNHRRRISALINPRGYAHAKAHRRPRLKSLTQSLYCKHIDRLKPLDMCRRIHTKSLCVSKPRYARSPIDFASTKNATRERTCQSIQTTTTKIPHTFPLLYTYVSIALVGYVPEVSKKNPLRFKAMMCSR